MAAIGSLVFCTACGNLLDHPNGGGGVEKGKGQGKGQGKVQGKGQRKDQEQEQAMLVCEVCLTENRDTADTTITTRSRPGAFPSELRDQLGTTQTLTEDDYNTRARTQVTCDRCGRTEVEFEEKQTRSADEGSTIFYYCSCGYAWTLNN